MAAGKLQAVENVRILAPLGREEDLRWFYSEVGGLDEGRLEGQTSAALSYRSERLFLIIQLMETPIIDPVPRRLTLLVADLAAATARLDEGGIAYQRLSGFVSTDRRVSAFDPAGNRVEIKQYWPDGAF